MSIKSRVKTASISMPAEWYERLDNMVNASKELNLLTTKSALVLNALRAYHSELQEVEKKLGIKPAVLKEL